ncbi:ATP-binding protein [Micromonospora sp. ATCC 39149]|uniref:ATP-binding protein n=1 Tax=Micromonospora sp. (strain ATCC 39149 / NRRL 15099 / SCC 1413) TaxID=219305 RepID=UPI00350F1D33
MGAVGPGCLFENEGETVTVSVRDEGPGIPAGRLDEAARQGRLGVAQSIRGRMADLGGTARITSTPGAGTEVELTVPRTTR